MMEAEAKFKKVYMGAPSRKNFEPQAGIVKTADMEAISKIVKRCLDRIR